LVKVLTALAITAFIPSLGVAAESVVWDGYLPGQLSAQMLTDHVAGEKTSKESEGKYAWNGFISGTAGSPMEIDRCVLPAAGSGAKDPWNGCLSGSMNLWEEHL
jgi:hypothetical protein